MSVVKLAQLRAGLETVQSELSLQQLIALIAIASRPGLSVNELAEELNLPQQTASRYVSILLGRYQNVSNTVPVPLITQQINDEDPRKRALLLTEQGQQRLNRLLEAMNK
ncbi:MarR family winged helix-turn-helix transcriptional regulator [Dongia soli]|uniref:MarR family transcriptional regulator n=1 Tax=Dongia soli TaxID=600628 RepID=A0ABU5EJ86_9PROT|nr:MarR family transcriptional regulator [Dongia soli]MDY0885378.1 MarR family transcriptional regulator [Dongia soli]